MTYQKHSITFMTDYDRSNPMSEKESNLKYLEKMKEAGELDKKQYDQQKNYFNQGGRFGGVMNYGAQVNNLQSRAINTYRPMNYAPGAQMQMPMYRMPQRYIVANPQMMQGFNRPGMYGRPMMVSRAAFVPRGGQPIAYQQPRTQYGSNVQPTPQYAPQRPQPVYQPQQQQPVYQPQQQPMYQPQQQVYRPQVQPVYQPQAQYQPNRPVYNPASPATQQPVYNPAAQYTNPSPQYYQPTATTPNNAQVAPQNNDEESG
jgi:hypothetical protein